MNGFLHTAGRKRHRGFTLLELVMAMAVGTILTAIAVPVVVNAQKNLRLTSAVSAISGGISQTRYQSIMTSQVYTLTINAAAGTYVVTNVATGAAGTAIPYSTSGVAINGGSGTYTFLFCPNGTVWAGGAACPGAGAPPAITAAYESRQINLNVSSVGNVTTVQVQ
jgi:prepilin-type N-terminal cleavage/methylation domain-containing protein